MHIEGVDFVTVPTQDSGAEVTGVEDTGVCHMGFVRDPDGNVLILHRRYAEKARRGQG